MGIHQGGGGNCTHPFNALSALNRILSNVHFDILADNKRAQAADRAVKLTISADINGFINRSAVVRLYFL